MTKTAKTEKTAEAKTASETINETIQNIQSRIEVPAVAREFVQRNAASAQERADSFYSGAKSVTDGAEKAAVSLVGGYAKFVRGLIDATHANVEHTLVTVEKVAGAKCLREAMQIQADFVRDNAQANYDRAREAAEYARETVTEGVSSVRDQAAKYWPYGKKAA